MLRCPLGWLVVCFLTLRWTLRERQVVGSLCLLCLVFVLGERREDRGQRTEERGERGEASSCPGGGLPSATLILSRPPDPPVDHPSLAPPPPARLPLPITLSPFTLSLQGARPPPPPPPPLPLPPPGSWVTRVLVVSPGLLIRPPPCVFSSLCVLLLVRTSRTAWRRRRRGGGV